MALQGIRRISAGIVQDPSINSGRPIIEGTRVFVDRIIGHLENGMSIVEICHEYNLTPEQVQAVKQLSPEQVQCVKGYADALENVVIGYPTNRHIIYILLHRKQEKDSRSHHV